MGGDIKSELFPNAARRIAKVAFLKDTKLSYCFESSFFSIDNRHFITDEEVLYVNPILKFMHSHL